jgi:DNA-binding beta-propeller fold protein YncE
MVSMLKSKIEGNIQAPDFPPDLEWLNVNRPIRIEELRGKIVLLGFWTYCCVNCMHALNDLRRLEEKYGRELVIIGVHSAKFTMERNTGNIRQAVMRYGVNHPVVNDYRMEIFNSYDVRTWPTLVLIDPQGIIVSCLSGEGTYDELDQSIAGIRDKFEMRNEIDHFPIEIKLEMNLVSPGFLSFPGKVLADEKTNQLFISDSSHNRVVIFSLDEGILKHIIGKGEMGAEDGDFESASFNHPQGLAFDGERLFVADTNNHLIREINLVSDRVSTLAGTGSKAVFPYSSGHARQVPLNSPWDLVIVDEDLFIAMAGTNQIWKMELRTNIISVHAGTGQLARIDGPLGHAAMAQPSGITADGKKLYFADSEVSSIRCVELVKGGIVETIAGGDLFDYGDTDAAGQDARLQHPLGIDYRNNCLYVADTYNNKIKCVDIRERFSKTFAGTGQTGFRDGNGNEAQFNEPGGVSIVGEKIFVADTNNHAIRKVDISTGNVETVKLKGTEGIPGNMVQTNSHTRFTGETVQLHAQSVEPGDVELNILLEFPEGYRLKEEAPSALKVTTLDPGVVNFDYNSEVVFQNIQLPLKVKAWTNEGETVLQIDLMIYYCREAEVSLCMFRETKILLLVNVQKGAETTELKACYRVPPI